VEARRIVFSCRESSDPPARISPALRSAFSHLAESSSHACLRGILRMARPSVHTLCPSHLDAPSVAVTSPVKRREIPAAAGRGEADSRLSGVFCSHEKASRITASPASHLFLSPRRAGQAERVTTVASASSRTTPSRFGRVGLWLAVSCCALFVSSAS